MSTAHTPGPMKLECLMGSIKVGSRDENIFHCGLGLRHHSIVEEQEANARRLAACWNACDGVSAETLQVFIDGGGIEAVMEKMLDEIDALKAQRDELLTLNADALAQLLYLRDCIETGTEPGMSEPNAVIRKLQGRS